MLTTNTAKPDFKIAFADSICWNKTAHSDLEITTLRYLPDILKFASIHPFTGNTVENGAKVTTCEEQNYCSFFPLCFCMFFLFLAVEFVFVIRIWQTPETNRCK